MIFIIIVYIHKQIKMLIHSYCKMSLRIFNDNIKKSIITN